MDCVSPIIEIVKFVGGPIVRHLEYQIRFNHHLEQFNEGKQCLGNRKRDIESKLNTERHYGKVAMEEVQKWLNDAEKFIAREEVADGVNGWGCLSCCCRVKILKEKARELKEIYDRGASFLNECLVKDDPSISTEELPTTELQGSGDVKVKILTSLMGDEVTKIGVWGMGGIGKTTIMKHVRNELLKEGKFKKVIWVTVSHTFDICKLQQQIACSLKENLPEDQNITTRAATLSQMLERHRPYLVILDDVWSSFELDDVGIPEPLVSNGCKLVLTTRSQEVARPMGCKVIQVKTLSGREALELFVDKVGDTVLSDQGCIKGALKSTLEGIVNECDGLPLAIVTVAGSLKGISEPPLWRAALNQLKNCKRDVACANGDPFGILKFSYDRLKTSKIQHCFLCCALYPEDCNIPIDSIIEYWIDEGLIDEVETLQAMEDDGHDVLRALVDNCLLDSIEDDLGDDYVRMRDCVRMHDLVRDMALRITETSPRFMVKAGKGLTVLPEKGIWMEDLQKVSLMKNAIEEIPSGLLSSKCIMLTTLLLSYNKLSTIPDSVLERMPNLKILDLSYNRSLWSLPSSISRLVNLTTLLLQCCECLTELPSLSELRALIKLELRGTRISRDLNCLEMCTGLKYLGVGYLFGEVLDDAVLLKLSKLQQLFVHKVVGLKGEMIGRLKNLEAFDGRFPTVDDWNFFLNYSLGQGNGLSRYCLTIGRKSFIGGIEDPIHKHVKNFIALCDIDIVGENVRLLPSVSGLSIISCNNLRSLNDFPSLEDVKDMRECRINWCKGMEFVLSAWINPLVQTLEMLELDLLDRLEGLFEVEAIAMSLPLPAGTFSSLKEISVYRCNKIKKLIPSWKLLDCLQSLEEIVVWHCKEIEEIIASDQSGGGEGTEIIEKLYLPKLKSLSLSNLPALQCICSKRAVMVCDSLEKIMISSCIGVKRVPIDLDNAQPSLPSLKEIDVTPVEWWESLEWDHLNAKDILRPLIKS